MVDALFEHLQDETTTTQVWKLIEMMQVELDLRILAEELKIKNKDELSFCQNLYDVRDIVKEPSTLVSFAENEESVY